MKPIDVTRETLRYENGSVQMTEDRIVTEYPVTIKLNGHELMTMVCTPEYIEDMVIGFLASEGVISQYEDIQDLWVQEKEGFVHVQTKKLNPYFQDFQSKRYVTVLLWDEQTGVCFCQ